MGKSFIESFKESYKQAIEAENANKPESQKMTPQKERKNIVILIIGIVGIFFLVKSIIGGNNHSDFSRSDNHQSRTNSNSESTTPSFTCKNCGGHSFHNHETVTDMKVCNSCGIGQ